jgi:hypothetical protein
MSEKGCGKYCQFQHVWKEENSIKSVCFSMSDKGVCALKSVCCSMFKKGCGKYCQFSMSGKGLVQ